MPGGGGLEDVSLRHVAAEAGVSMRLVQYYFGNREDLLLAALAMLNAEAERQARERVTALGDDPGPRAVLRGVLAEMLPMDEERRTRHLVYVAYFVRMLRDERLGQVAKDAPHELENLVALLIGQGQERDQVPATVEADVEAALLLAAADGLQTSVLLGQKTPDEALVLIDHQLDRLFTTS